MDTSLLDAVRRHADACAGRDGAAPTPIPGLTAIRAAARTELSYQIQRPLVCLVLQGAKHVTMGSQSFTFRAGDSLVITADVPLASRGVKAGTAVIAPNGKAFDQDSIGMALATRNLLHELRGSGEITGGPKPFAPRDRSEFLSALDRAIVRIKRNSTPR